MFKIQRYLNVIKKLHTTIATSHTEVPLLFPGQGTLTNKCVSNLKLRKPTVVQHVQNRITKRFVVVMHQL